MEEEEAVSVILDKEGDENDGTIEESLKSKPDCVEPVLNQVDSSAANVFQSEVPVSNTVSNPVESFPSDCVEPVPASNPVTNPVDSSAANVFPVVDMTSNLLMAQGMSKVMILDQVGQQSYISLPVQTCFMVQNAAHGNIVLAPVGGLLNTATHMSSGLSLHQQPIPFIPSGSLVDKMGMNTGIPNGDVLKSTHEVNTGDENGTGNNAKPNFPNTGDPMAKPDIEKEVKKGEEKDESPMAKDLKGDKSIAKEKEFVNREENDRNPVAKDLKGETDESTVEKEDKVLNKKDRSPIAKDLKGEESSIAKEKEVVNREETDRNPVAKDLKGDTDESTVDKEDKV